MEIKGQDCMPFALEAILGTLDPPLPVDNDEHTLTNSLIA